MNKFLLGVQGYNLLPWLDSSGSLGVAPGTVTRPPLLEVAHKP
jgi:hypothetical protein